GDAHVHLAQVGGRAVFPGTAQRFRAGVRTALSRFAGVVRVRARRARGSEEERQSDRPADAHQERKNRVTSTRRQVTGKSLASWPRGAYSVLNRDGRPSTWQ